MFGNLGNLMKQFQQVQQRAGEMKDKLAGIEHSATAGGGLVGATVNGLLEVVDVTIDAEKAGLDPEQAEILADAVLAAIHEAARQAQEEAEGLQKELLGGLDLPPGLGL